MRTDDEAKIVDLWSEQVRFLRIQLGMPAITNGEKVVEQRHHLIKRRRNQNDVVLVIPGACA